MNKFFSDTSLFIFDFFSIKIRLSNLLPADNSGRLNKAIKFYQEANKRNGIYCGQLELSDSSWDMFIQGIVIGVDPTNN